jgi:hypothetical protein
MIRTISFNVLVNQFVQHLMVRKLFTLYSIFIVIVGIPTRGKRGETAGESFDI